MIDSGGGAELLGQCSPSEVSVVIPTYNRAHRLPTALHSVLEQTAAPGQVVVVDDGSTDSTPEVAQSFGSTIRYVRQRHRGVSAARNRGIRETTGAWVAFLDSDDLWHPDKLRHQLACVEATRSSVCFTGAADEDGRELDDLSRWATVTPGQLYAACRPGDCSLFRYEQHPFVQSLLVNRQVLERAGSFDESLLVAEDTRLVSRLVLRNGCAIVPHALVTVTRRGSDARLSNLGDAASALARYECAARVQAEVFWQVVGLDAKAAGVVRRKLAYFGSRQAEVLCALGETAAARRTARAAIDVRSGWRTYARSCLIAWGTPVARRRFTDKWTAPTTQRAQL